MKESEKKTKVELIIQKIKNHGIGVVVVLSFILITGIASIFDSIKKIDDGINGTEETSLDRKEDAKFSKQPEAIINKQEESINETFIEFYLLINSDMINSTILIDDEPAVIVKDNKIIKTIRVRQKSGQYNILIEANGQKCSKSVEISQKNQKVKLC